MDKVNCTRLTTSTQISTRPVFYYGIKAAQKTGGTINIYNEGDNSKTATLKIVPQYSVDTAAVSDLMPFGVACPNGLYVDLVTADEVYVYWG